MQKQSPTKAVISHALKLTVVGGFCLSSGEIVQADEPKSYTKPPMSAFSSQMNDALLGSGKYEKPVWNLHDTLGLPKWLSVSVEQRTRYESVDGSFLRSSRAGSNGGDQQIALQTDIWLEAKLSQFRVGAELLDARAEGADSGSKTLSNSQVDTADFIQGYAAWAGQNALYSGIGAEVIAGRQTLNFGSRRLVARNAFRNTINSFTGIRLRLLDYDKWQFNGFVTMPVIRYPTGTADLLDNVQNWDREDTHTWFSGGFLEVYNLGWGINHETYLYHLDEGDSNTNPTRNRRYFTPGMRFYIKPAKASFDFQLEAMGQFGTVRATASPADNRNLQHEAWSNHLDIGYTFDMPWSPRFALEYDYASGNTGNTSIDQRFDPLYGARRFDFGPTGIYGAFSRSNLSTPGYRVNASPRSDVQLTVDHRFLWLASATDCWGGNTCSNTAATSTTLWDPNGRSGDFVGQQLDLTARWDFNSSLNFESGWTHLFKGQFAKKAPFAPNGQDIDYFYVQSQLRF